MDNNQFGLNLQTYLQHICIPHDIYSFFKPFSVFTQTFSPLILSLHAFLVFYRPICAHMHHLLAPLSILISFLV